MAMPSPTGAGRTATIDFPEEFRVYLEYLELADPESYALFVHHAELTLP